MDQQPHSERADDGSNSVGLHDVAGLGNAQVVYHLQERAEVAVPTPVTEEQGKREETGAKDRSIQEERVRNECYGREEPLPRCEGDDEKDAKDEHAND